MDALFKGLKELRDIFGIFLTDLGMTWITDRTVLCDA